MENTERNYSGGYTRGYSRGRGKYSVETRNNSDGNNPNENKSNAKKYNNNYHPRSRDSVTTHQPDEELAREYSRYLAALQIKNAVECAICPRDHRQQYETDNIIERFMIEMANNAGEVDPLFTESADALDKLTEEIKEKFPHVSADSTEKMREKIISIIRDFVESSADNRKSQSISLNAINTTDTSDIANNIRAIYSSAPNGQTLFRCGKYEAKFPTERIKLLIGIAGERACSRMLMRYACLLSRGQQWSHESEFFDKLYNYCVRYEGFASPINSKLIKYSADSANDSQRAYFCSLFPDVDKPFGSIGRFFDVNFAKIARDNMQKNNNDSASADTRPITSIFLNPPFIESIFDRIADKIDAELHEVSADKADHSPRLRFIYASAYWPDASGIQKMLSSQYFRASRVMNKGQHNYIDVSGQKIPARFNTILILLDNCQVIGDVDNVTDTTDAQKILDDLAMQ